MKTQNKKFKTIENNSLLSETNSTSIIHQEP